MPRGETHMAGDATSNRPLASHPLEAYPEHRAFLIRSLDRCDVDLAALVELNRSLHKVKAAIVDNCGEGTLLDIGEGLIALDTTRPDEIVVTEGTVLPEDQKHWILDFLLRMKLRRGLLNRLARRLNRLARAMDGEDVAPPAVPKFGEMRLHIDPVALANHNQHVEEYEAALKRLRARHQQGVVAVVSDMTRGELDELGSKRRRKKEQAIKEAEKNKSSTKAEEVLSSPTKATTADEAAAKVHDGTLKNVDDAKPNEAVSDAIQPGESKEPTTSEDQEKIVQPNEKSEEGQKSSEVECGTETKQEKVDTKPSDGNDDQKQEELQAMEAISLPSVDEVQSGAKLEVTTASVAFSRALDKDYAVLSSFKAGYRKARDPKTGEIQYLTLDQDPKEEEFLKSGPAVGTNNVMSQREKEGEYKRWQGALLSKIPDQPTFEDLGMEGRVFQLEERRKRLAEGNIEKEESPKKKPKKDEQDKEENVNEEKSPSKKEKKKQDEDKDDEDDEEDDEEMVALPLMKKTMSMIPVPSFYEQDMKRIRTIHSDLLATSFREHARRRITETTQEYNRCFQNSASFYDQRIKQQTEATNLANQNRMDIAKVKNDYKIKVGLAKARWEKGKVAFSRQRAMKLMHSMQGRQAVGTQLTQRACRHPDQFHNQVGLTLGRIVDCVVMRVDQGIGNEKYEDFRPPTAPSMDTFVVNQQTRETYSERHRRFEKAMQQNIQNLNQRLQKSEQERERAWRKLIKTKAELDVGGRRRIDPSRLPPMPQLRNSGMASMPNETTFNPDIPEYKPPRRDPEEVPAEDSEYSPQILGDRIRADGTIMPVGELKKDEQGNFVCPPDVQQHKGMDWDSKRGVWVPGQVEMV